MQCADYIRIYWPCHQVAVCVRVKVSCRLVCQSYFSTFDVSTRQRSLGVFFSFFQLSAHYLNECSLSFNFVNFSYHYLSLFFVSGVCVFVGGLFLLFSSMTIYNFSDTVFLLFSDSKNYKNGEVHWQKVSFALYDCINQQFFRN